MYKKSKNQRNVHPQQQLSLLCDLLYTIYFILLSSHTDHLLSDYSPGSSSLPISWEKMELEFVPYRWDDVSCDVNASSETMEAGRGKKKKILWYWILWRVERGPSPPWVFLFIHFLIHRWDAWRGEALPNASGWGIHWRYPTPAPNGPMPSPTRFFSAAATATTTHDKKFKFSTTDADKKQQFGYSTNATTLITHSPTETE